LKFATECYASARKSRCYVFKLKKDKGPLHVHFNYSQDQVEIDNYLLTSYAHANINDGDEIAKEWEKEGWQKLGPRVSWRLTPHAIEFALVSGHRRQLRRAALREWYDDKGFPALEEIT
jgi:hypothetical protein